MMKEWLLGQNENTEACDDEIFLNQGAEAVILSCPGNRASGHRGLFPGFEI